MIYRNKKYAQGQFSEENEMKVYDRIKKEELDLTNKELIDLMANHNR